MTEKSSGWISHIHNKSALPVVIVVMAGNGLRRGEDGNKLWDRSEEQQIRREQEKKEWHQIKAKDRTTIMGDQ